MYCIRLYPDRSSESTLEIATFHQLHEGVAFFILQLFERLVEPLGRFGVISVMRVHRKSLLWPYLRSVAKYNRHRLRNEVLSVICSSKNLTLLESFLKMRNLRMALLPILVGLLESVSTKVTSHATHVAPSANSIVGSRVAASTNVSEKSV